MTFQGSIPTNASIVVNDGNPGGTVIPLANTICSVMYKENDNTTEIRVKRPDEQWKAKPYKGSCVFDNGDGKCVKPRPDDDWMFYEGKAYLNKRDGTNPYYVSLDPWNHKRTSRCTSQGGPIGYQNSLLATLADIDSKLAGLPESGDMSTNASTGTMGPVRGQRTATKMSTEKKQG